MSHTATTPPIATADTGGRRPRVLSYERRILLLSLAGGVPAVAVALALLWRADLAPRTQWTLSALVLGAWVGAACWLCARIGFQLRTVSNALAAMVEGDYSLQVAQGDGDDGPLGQILRQVNVVLRVLNQHRMGTIQSTTLLRKMLSEIDVAVLAFDADQRLRLVNRYGERLLGAPAERLLGASAEQLGLAECLAEGCPHIVELALPGGAGRWEVRRGAIREAGLPQTLLMLSDLTRPLREEERLAWQRLTQVLRHEINNSLAPIHSLAGSLALMLRRPDRATGWEEDLREGLAVISQRSAALNRFMSAYSRLTRLPPPQPGQVSVGDCVRRVIGLESRLKPTLEAGPELTIQADGDQIEQLLINLLRNAADAALETQGGVRVGWAVSGHYLEVQIEDNGPGLADTSNLFVPFFTTKPQGSGIGLVLSRQIAEAHGGTVTLANRAAARGCRAVVRLPIGSE